MKQTSRKTVRRGSGSQPIDYRGPLGSERVPGPGTGPRERACPELGGMSELQSDWTGFRRGSVSREALKGQMGN